MSPRTNLHVTSHLGRSVVKLLLEVHHLLLLSGVVAVLSLPLAEPSQHVIVSSFLISPKIWFLRLRAVCTVSELMGFVDSVSLSLPSSGVGVAVSVVVSVFPPSCVFTRLRRDSTVRWLCFLFGCHV